MLARHFYLLLLLFLWGSSAAYAQSDYKTDSIKIYSLIEQGRQEAQKSITRGIKMLEAALAIARKGGYKQFEATCLSDLSYQYLRVRRDVEALDATQKALKIFEVLKDTQQIIFLYDDIGRQFVERKDYKKAFESYYRSLTLAKKSRDRTFVLDPYWELAVTHDMIGRYDSALFYNDASLTLAKYLKATHRVNILYANLAITYKHLKQYDSALNISQRILPYFESRGDSDMIASTYANIGVLFTETRRYKEAEEYLLKSLRILEVMGSSRLPNIAEDFVDLYETKGDYAKALEWHKRGTALSDSFFNIAKSEQLTEMETRYETDKKQQAIDNLEQAAELQAAQLSRQKLLRNLVIAITLFVLLVAGILYRNYKRSQRFNKQLEEQKARLEELDVIKNKLFSAISHDLRSPMMSLDATLSLLQEQNITQEKLQKYTTHLNASMNATLNLLDNLLNWSMSQMKGLNLVPTTVNLKELAEENMQLYAAAADKKNIRLVSEIDANATAHVDRNIGRLVLRNLINNAIKFTPERGEVKLSSENHNSEVEIRIQDNGIGMAAEHVKMLFELRMGNTRQGTAKEKGTGLGLVLCKELMEKSGGSISVESELEKGSTFSIRLPQGKDKVTA